MNLIILGPQGSGKGTQGELLAKKYNLVFLGAGDALREVAKTQTELGRFVHQTINVEGRLVPPEVIGEVMKDKLEMLSAQQGVILESYPRTLEQYEYMKKFWVALGRGDFRAIYIELPEEESIKRLGSRFICDNCGAIFIGRPAEVCPKCGKGRIIQRQDDRPEAIRLRLSWSNSELSALVKVLEQEGKLMRIDGRPPIEEVHREIVAKLELK